MKLCSINCETKCCNLPLATYISEKIIFHALTYTVSFYWVASCAVWIKSTEDAWESHLKSENANHRFVCLVGRKMFHESQFLQLQLNSFHKTQRSNSCSLGSHVYIHLVWLHAGDLVQGCVRALWELGTQLSFWEKRAPTAACASHKTPEPGKTRMAKFQCLVG